MFKKQRRLHVKTCHVPAWILTHDLPMYFDSPPFSILFISTLRCRGSTIFARIYLLFCLFFRSYRYAAYRQFCWFIHSRLGKGVRKVIPSCVVSKIREVYPSEDGKYTGYKDGDEVPEMTCPWETEEDS